MFRAGYMPVYGFWFQHWLGVAFGFSFNKLKDFK